jgi:hypothetical protein
MRILTKWYPQFLDHKANTAVLFPNTIPFLIPNTVEPLITDTLINEHLQ